MSKRNLILITTAFILSLIIVITCGYFLYSCNKKPVDYLVDDKLSTVIKEAPSDGSTPMDYSALDNIAFLNQVFKNQPYYISEMQGMTDASGIPQSVSSYKQKHNGVVIATEITSSSMIKNARQFCYVNDTVLWRNASSKSYNGLNTEWSTAEPSGHLSVEDFKNKYGLPATELFAYVINENTLLSSTDVIDNGDLTYTFSVSLDPTDKTGAGMHYAKQMVFSGGLNDYPKFDYFNLTFTINSKWEICSLQVNEAYDATMGITVYCVSDFLTTYTYDQEKAYSSAYEEYFKQYEESEFIATPENNEPTAVNCLGTAFSSVLSGPTTFNVNLKLGDTSYDGLVYLDASSALDSEADLINQLMVRAKIGNLSVWLEKGEVYLALRNVKAKLTIAQAKELLADLAPELKADNTQNSGEGAFSSTASESDNQSKGEFNMDGLLEALGNGDFTYEDKKNANLDCKLSLLGLDIPLQFAFNLDQTNTPSLDYVSTDIQFNQLPLSASLSFGDQEIKPLSEQAKTMFVEVKPLADTVMTLLDSEWLSVNVDGEIDDVQVKANLDFNLKGLDTNDLLDSLSVKGYVKITHENLTKSLSVAVDKGVAYIYVDGISVKASLKEAGELISGFIPQKAKTEQSALNLEKTINAVLSDEFLKAIRINQNQSTVTAVIRLNRALSVLGINLGDVGISQASLKIDNENQAVRLSTDSLTLPDLGKLALSVEIEKATDVKPLDTSGYVDLAPLVNNLLDIFSQDVLEAKIDYHAGKLSVDGDVIFSLAQPSASARLELKYGDSTHNIEVIYSDDCLYLNVSGLKIKANTEQAIELIVQELGISLDSLEISEQELLNKVFAIDFGSILSLSDSQDCTSALINLDNVLAILGLDLSLGKASIDVYSQKLAVELLGVSLTLTKTDKKVASPINPQEYLDVMPTATVLTQIIRDKALSFNGVINLGLKDVNAKLIVTQGTLSFKNNINATFNGSIEIDDVVLSVYANISSDKAYVVLGGVAVEITYSELSDLESAVFELYNEFYDIVGDMSDTTNPLPQINGLDDLISLLKGSSVALQSLSAFAESNQTGDVIESILKEIKLSNNLEENGVLNVALDSIVLNLFQPDKSSLSATAIATLDDISLSANVTAQPIGSTNIETPNVEYLNVTDFIEMLDYGTALINTLTKQDLTLNVNVQNGSKQNIAIKIDFHSGDSVPLRFNLENKEFYISTELFLHVYFAIDDLTEKNNDLYFDIWLFDKDGDGLLDAIVQVSKLHTTDSAYKPLVITASESEIMTLLASAATLTGLNEGFIKDWLVDNWLSATTANQLEAIGDSLLKSLNLSGLLSSIDFTAFEISPNGKTVYDNLLALGLSKNDDGNYDGKFNLTLDSKLLFGVDKGDIVFNLQKSLDENGNSVLNLVQLNNVYLDGDEKLDLLISAEYNAIDTSEPIINSKAVSFNAQGLSELIKVIGESTTHQATPDDIANGLAQNAQQFVLNNNFFIDGTASVKILTYEIEFNIRALSISVDPDGEVVINAKLDYEHKKFLLTTLINGDSTVDLTIKNGLIYARRIQTSDSNGKALASPETLYRVFPANSFTSDTLQMLEHLGFMFNFSDTIMDIIRDNVKEDGATEASGQDLGDLAQGILTSYSYSANKWNAVLNGSKLTDDVLGDINVTIGAENGLIRNLDLSTKLVSIINVSASLKYRNPKGVMDSGVSDTSVDMSIPLEKAMDKKLAQMNECDWTDQSGKPTYLQAKMVTVSFISQGANIYEQQLATDWQTGEVFGTLNYPENPQLVGHEFMGYKLNQLEISPNEQFEALNGDVQLTATFGKKEYNVTFTSAIDMGAGWTYDSGLGLWTLTDKMSYDSEVIIKLVDSEVVYTVSDNEELNVFSVPTLSEGLSWGEFVFDKNGFTVIAKDGSDYVTLTSQVSFDYSDGVNQANNAQTYKIKFKQDLTLVSPTAQGYTFLGWYVNDNGSYSKIDKINFSNGQELDVTVEALWVSDLKVSFESVTVTSSGVFKKTHTSKILVSGGKLYGSFASQLVSDGGQLNYRYWAKSNQSYSASNGAGLFTKDATATTSNYLGVADEKTLSQQISSSQSYVHVVVTLKYNINGETIYVGEKIGDETGIYVNKKIE